VVTSTPNAAARAQRVRYGADPAQVADLHLPAAGEAPWPVVVVIHGGFWRARYDVTLGTALGMDLARHGFAAWNIEYRRVGNGGGWPTTLIDVAAAVDALATAGQEAAAGRLDLNRVIALGHSAGGHLAAWLTGRVRLSHPFGPPTVAVTAVVSQAGVLDLQRASTDRLGDGATDAFMRGARRPADWAAASPIRLLPVGVTIRCVHGDADDTVPIQQSADFVAVARAAGDDAALISITGGDHFGVITPGDLGWTASLQAVADLAATS